MYHWPLCKRAAVREVFLKRPQSKRVRVPQQKQAGDGPWNSARREACDLQSASPRPGTQECVSGIIAEHQLMPPLSPEHEQQADHDYQGRLSYSLPLLLSPPSPYPGEGWVGKKSSLKGNKEVNPSHILLWASLYETIPRKQEE